MIQICLWHQLNRQPKVVELNQIECVTYLKRAIYSLVSFEVLLLSNASLIVSSDHRSINIVAPEANFATISRRIPFFPRKVQAFGALKAFF